MSQSHEHQPLALPQHSALDVFRNRHVAAGLVSLAGLAGGFGALANRAEAQDGSASITQQPMPNSQLTNADTINCQAIIAGYENDNKYTPQDFIKSMSIRKKAGNHSLKVTVKIDDVEIWGGPQFRYDCDQITDNYATLQLVKRVKGQKDANGDPATKPIGKAKKVRGDDRVSFDGRRTNFDTRTVTFSLPKNTPKAELKKKKLFGIKPKIVSKPTLPNTPFSLPSEHIDLPGPLPPLVDNKMPIQWVK